MGRDINGFVTVRPGRLRTVFYGHCFRFYNITLSLIPLVSVEEFQNDFIALIHDIVPPKTFDVIDNVICRHRYETQKRIDVVQYFIVCTAYGERGKCYP